MGHKPVTADRIAKLPLWVRQYIGRLQRDQEFVQAQLDQVTGVADTPIRWEYSPRKDDWHGIPARATIRFDILRGTIEATIRNGVLLLRNYQHGRIMVQPSDYNGLSVNIEPREHFEADGLLEVLRDLEARDTFADMEDSGIVKCERCGRPVGESHLPHCPYHPLPRLAS